MLDLEEEVKRKVHAQVCVLSIPLIITVWPGRLTPQAMEADRKGNRVLRMGPPVVCVTDTVLSLSRCKHDSFVG